MGMGGEAMREPAHPHAGSFASIHSLSASRRMSESFLPFLRWLICSNVAFETRVYIRSVRGSPGTFGFGPVPGLAPPLGIVYTHTFLVRKSRVHKSMPVVNR